MFDTAQFLNYVHQNRIIFIFPNFLYASITDDKYFP